MTEFTNNVIEVIKSIPKGKVLTYGKIARICGNSRGARQVVRILSSLSEKYDLPWYRVINSKGEISLKGEGALVQALKLVEEGVEVKDGKIDLTIYMER